MTAPDRVELVRTGGLAGLRLRASLDLEALGPAERAGLDAVRASSTTDALPRGADRFVYRITVVTTSSSEAVQLGEADVPGRAWPLLRRLEQAADAP